MWRERQQQNYDGLSAKAPRLTHGRQTEVPGAGSNNWVALSHAGSTWQEGEWGKYSKQRAAEDLHLAIANTAECFFSFQKRLDGNRKTHQSPRCHSSLRNNQSPNEQISHKSQDHLQSFLYSAPEHWRAAPFTFPQQQSAREPNSGPWVPRT